MQRQRDGLVPIGEALADLPGPVQAIREATPQALHHYTRFDQVNQLVSASEADPDLGFMARLLALCSLPRTNPGNRHQYKRVNGPFKLIMIAGGDNKLPYGNLPRLLLAWLSTEAVRTRSRELVLGRSLSEFMRTLGVYSSGGRDRTRLRNQMKRLFSATVQLIYEDEHGAALVSSSVADRTEFWWNERQPDERSLWESKIELGEKFYNEIVQPSGSAQHEHPHGHEALFTGPRSLPVAHLSHLRPPRSAAALMAAGVPAVRSGPGPRQRQSYRPQLPTQGSPRVEEDQDGLAWPELFDGSGRPDPASLDPGYRAAQSRPVNKLGSPFPASQRPVSGLCAPG